MRVHFVAFLAAVAAIGTSDGVSVTTNSNLTTSRFAVAANTKRFLRTETFIDEAEDRGFSLNAIPGIVAIKKINAIPGIGAIKNIFSKKVTPQKLLAYAKKNKPPSFVFKKLRLDKVDATMLFKNPDFNVWVAYVRLVNRTKMGAEKSMITSLVAQYGDEVVARVLQVALKDKKTEEIAKALLSKQLEGWKDLKLSNDGVFKLLQLNHGVDDLLVNPNLSLWLKYVHSISKNSLDDEAIMIKTFVTHYSDESLMTMILSAKRVPATEVVASKLQTELLKVWQSINKSPEDVFTLLKLDLDGLLVNPMLKTWTKYLDDFNVNNPISKESMIDIFTKTYGDEALSKMLNAAKTDAKTTKVATDLQRAQLENWVKHRKEQREVYNLLEVKGTSADSANRALWKQYVRDYNKKWITGA